LILQLTPFRFFTVYIVQSILLGFYLGLAYKLLRKKDKISRKRLIFGIYYLTCSIGLILNYIYALIQHEIITSLLYKLTIYILYVGANFISIFAIAMYFEIKDNTNTSKIQIYDIILFSALYFVLFFIPDGVVTSNETRWYPVVALSFFLYVSILVGLSLTIFIFYSIKTLRIFKKRNENKIILNRWKIYIIGITESFIFATFTMLVHFLNNKSIRDIWAIFGGFLFIIGVYLTWYGIGKKFL